MVSNVYDQTEESEAFGGKDSTGDGTMQLSYWLYT